MVLFWLSSFPEKVSFDQLSRVARLVCPNAAAYDRISTRDWVSPMEGLRRG